jgi:hypothetical protein
MNSARAVLTVALVAVVITLTPIAGVAHDHITSAVTTSLAANHRSPAGGTHAPRLALQMVP